MSIAASLSAPFPGAAGSAIAGDAGRREWITLAEASRILGAHPNAIKSMTIAGGIRSLVRPGARILYSRSDAQRLASAG